VTPLRLTNSEMAMARECRRKWYLSTYLRRGKREPDFGKPTGLGTRVHNALEALYDPLRQDVDPLQLIRDGVQEDIERFPSYADDIVKEGEMALIMMEGYLQWLAEEGEDMNLELVSSEEGVEVPLPPFDPAKVTLLSKIDSRVRSKLDGSRWAMDHKTVGDLSTPLPLLQIDTQLLTEHLAEFLKLSAEVGQEEALRQRVDGVFYNMLKKVKRTARAKPPFYKREPVRHNMHELRHHWEHVVAQANEIIRMRERLDAGESHHTVCYPSPGKDCSWKCPFFQLCPMLDDGSDWGAALDDLYEVVDPLARYSREEAKFTKEEPK
jgi:hypothetical protein